MSSLFRLHLEEVESSHYTHLARSEVADDTFLGQTNRPVTCSARQWSPTANDTTPIGLVLMRHNRHVI